VALIEKNYWCPLECHDDVQKRSLKQKCFQMSPEWIQWLSRCNFVRQAVPHARCSNRESSVADRWQPDMRHHQAIGVGGAEWSTTRHIGNTNERPEVTWCLIVQKFVSLAWPAWTQCVLEHVASGGWWGRRWYGHGNRDGISTERRIKYRLKTTK